MFRVAFASCCNWHVRKKQPAWNRLRRKSPDLLILLGDNIYSRGDDYLFEPPLEGEFPEDRHGLRLRYEEQFAVKSFRRVMRDVPFLATWDDHDLGPNNAMGGEPEAAVFRDTSRALFREFLAPQVGDQGRLGPVPGEIYHSYVAGGVHFIVLDCRYHRRLPTRGTAAELLGEAQEDWLWQQLEAARSGPARATVVCVGPTFLDSRAGERLADYGDFYEMFNDAIGLCPTPIVLSGDIHRNAVVAHEGFVELTSSGVAQRALAPDGSRTGPKKDNYGIIDFKDDEIRVRLYHATPEGEDIEFLDWLDYLPPA